MTLDRLVGRAYSKLPDGFRNGLTPLTVSLQYVNSLLPHALRHGILRQTIAGGDNPANVANSCARYSTASMVANAVVGVAALIIGPFLPSPLNLGALGFGAYALVDTPYRFWPLRKAEGSENPRGTLAIDFPYRVLRGDINPLDVLKGSYQQITQIIETDPSIIDRQLGRHLSGD